MARTRFPAVNHGDDYDDMLERLGGVAKVPKLGPCRICGRLMWRWAAAAHVDCMGEGFVRGNPDAASPVPLRPDPVIGNVYATRMPDGHVSQVSDRQGAENERRAREAVDRLATCSVCRRALTAGQRGRHWACTPEAEWPQAKPAKKSTDQKEMGDDTSEDG